MKKRIVVNIMVGSVLLLSFTANSQNSKVTWSSFNMGFAELKTSNTMVKSVVGQSFVGNTQLANTEVISGFLADTLFRSILVAVKEQEGLPKAYALAQNYPNPFNPTTTIRYELPKASPATLAIYNILGARVATIVDGLEAAGYHQVEFNASQLASGVYFYRLHAGSFTETKKLVLIR